MKMIELRADIGEDRHLVLELPGDTPVGTHRVVVYVEESTDTGNASAARYVPGDLLPPGLAWEGNRLVLTGTLEQGTDFDWDRCVELDRHERMEQIWGGPLPCE